MNWKLKWPFGRKKTSMQQRIVELQDEIVRVSLKLECKSKQAYQAECLAQRLQQQAMQQQAMQQQAMQQPVINRHVFGQLNTSTPLCTCSHSTGDKAEVEKLLGTWKECTCGRCPTKQLDPLPCPINIGYEAKLEKIQDLLASGLITAQAAREMLDFKG